MTLTFHSFQGQILIESLNVPLNWYFISCHISVIRHFFSPGGHILAPEYSHLNSYVFPFDFDNAVQLVPVGYQENVGMGRRFASRLQELLENATEDELRLISSVNTRNIDSAEAFRQVI